MKAQLNGAQYGWEITKERKTKSGQSVDEYAEDEVCRPSEENSLKMTDKVDEESRQELSDSVVSDRDPNKLTNLLKENKRKKRAEDANKEKQNLYAKCIDVLNNPSLLKFLLNEDPFAL